LTSLPSRDALSGLENKSIGQTAEHVALVVGAEALGRLVKDTAFIARPALAAAHGYRQEWRQVPELGRPVAHNIVLVGLDPDRGLSDVGIVDRLDEGVHELLLPDLDVIAVVGIGGIAEPDRRLHLVKRFDEHQIVGLRLVDQNIDTDRLRAHRVDVGQRIGEGRAIERRALAGGALRVRREGDKDNALVLVDGALERREQRPHVIQGPLRIDGEGNGLGFAVDDDRRLPAETRQEGCEDDEDNRRDTPGKRHTRQILANSGESRLRFLRERVGRMPPMDWLVHRPSRDGPGARARACLPLEASPSPPAFPVKIAESSG
jgi:hypothetical protein